MPLQKLLKMVGAQKPAEPSIPEGQRIYAIGDIHGRSDLLDELLSKIEEDQANVEEETEVLLIFLGDLVDRGPDSKGVIERLLAFSRSEKCCRFLTGNHEEVFLQSLSGDVRALRQLIRMGGRETILSYGMSPDEYISLDFEELLRVLQDNVPAEHVDFLSSFEKWIEVGDYLFVHAGIRPGIPIDEQSPTDLCWIRENFLRSRESFGKIVVHGHTISEKPDIRANRIGIDTGAFATGRLTALGLQGQTRWILST